MINIDWPVKYNRCLKILSDGLVILPPAHQWEETLLACNVNMCGFAEKCKRGEMKPRPKLIRRQRSKLNRRK